MKVKLELYNKLWIKVNCENQDYLRGLKEQFTTYKEGFQFSPLFQSGTWDGKISLFKNKTLPYGLLTDFLKFHKKYYSDFSLKIDPKIKSLYTDSEHLEHNYNLKYYPYPHQKDSIEAALKVKKCFLELCTAFGKSLVISYILKILFDNKKIKKALIVVPTISLVEQFYTDLLDYKMPYEIGKVWADEKNWENPITISTWQSLTIDHENLRKTNLTNAKKKLKILNKENPKTNNEKIKKQEDLKKIKEKIEKLESNDAKKEAEQKTKEIKEKLKNIDAVFIDEAHETAAISIRNLLQVMKDTEYRFGCTGTLPDNILDIWNIKSFIGPVIRQYKTDHLERRGYLAKCNVHRYFLNYNNIEGEIYSEVKSEIFSREKRLELLKDIIVSIKNQPILILVGKIEDEGKLLENYLKENEVKKEIIFVNGQMKAEEREYWRQKAINNEDLCIIATYGVFQSGINIPNLTHVIFAALFKSKIRVLQSIGRILRKHANKKTGAYVYDIIDNHKWFIKHAQQRLDYYVAENFNVTDY